MNLHHLAAFLFVLLMCLTAGAIAPDRHGATPPDDSTALTAHIDSLWRLGNYHQYREVDYQRSYDYLCEAREQAERHGLRRRLPYIYRDLAGLQLTDGIAHRVDSLTAQSLTLYRLAFREALRGSDDKALTSVFINLMEMVSEASTLDSLQQEIDIFGRHAWQSPLYRYAMLFREGIVACYGQHDYQHALDCFGRMAASIGPMEERADSVRYVLAARSKAVQACYLQGDPAAAVGQMKAIEAEGRRWGMHDVTTDACHALWQYYDEAGQQPEADAYRLRYLEAKDSLLTEQRLERMADLRLTAQLEKAGAEMRLLSYRHRVQLWSIAGLCVFIIMLLAVIAIIAYNYRRLQQKNRVLYRQSLQTLTSPSQPAPQRKYQSSDLDDETKESLAGRIRDVLATADAVYDPDFTAERLSELVGAKYRHVSQVVNECYGKSFTALLTEHRIQEACRRMNDADRYGHYTVEGIALSVGFRSRPNFVSNFKRLTGLTPSEYLRQARKACTSA